MTELPVASRNAVVALVDRCPDRVLADLAIGLRTLPGAKARAVHSLIEQEQADRRLRGRVFGAVEALFATRTDHVAARTLPPALGRAVWRGLKMRQASLIEQARPSCASPEPPLRVLDQLCASAASLLRDDAERLWPADPALALDAATYFDLAPLARRALARLPAWIVRVGDAEAVELRLLMRDAVEITPDGAPRVLEILFANIDHAPLILRLIAQSSGSAADEAFLAGSELADFGDRLFASVEARAERFMRFDPAAADPAEASGVAADLSQVADLLEELGLSLDLTPDGVWGKRAQALRSRLSDRLNRLIRECEPAVERALPMERVKTSGRMQREAPKLDAPLDGPAMARALALMTLFEATRQSAAAFGCGGSRTQAVESLSRRLGAYGDGAMDEINAGGVADRTRALALAGKAGDFLALAGDATTARALRRRVAAAEADAPSQRVA